MGKFLYDQNDSVGNGDICNYIALGGDRQSKLIAVTLTTAAGTHAITGAGFAPELAIIYGAAAFPDNLTDCGMIHLGAATSASEQWACAIGANDDVLGNARSSSFYNDRIIETCSVTGGGAGNDHTAFTAVIDSFDADGITLDKTVPPAEDVVVMVLLLAGGGSYKVGVFDGRSSTGTQNISLSFDPAAVLLATTRRTAFETSSDASLSIGAFDDTRQRAAWTGADSTALNTSNDQSTNQALTIGRTVTGTKSILAKADGIIVSGGFDLDWSVADGSVYKIGYVAFEEAAVDRFAYVNTANDLAVPTPITAKCLLGFGGSITAASDEATAEGSSIGFSACDENLFHHSASFADYSNQPFGGVIQSSRYLSSSMFGVQRRVVGGLISVGAESTVHDCIIVALLRWMPQIYRRVIQHPRVAGIIDLILGAIGENHETITDEIPDRFDFTDGETGTQISDGGEDMYDGGNELSTNLGGSIPYTASTVKRSTSLFGPGSEYFTTKHPGIFTLVATGIDIDTFTVSGDTGADGTGFVEGSTLQTTVNGQLYTIFVKRIWGTEFGSFTASPSINQFIIVKGDGTGLTHDWSTDTDDCFQEVSGLTGHDELYYIVVSQYVEVPDGETTGPVLETTDMENVVTAFLDLLPPLLPGPYEPVPHLVTNFPDDFESVVEHVPNPYYFSEGLTGTDIGDGGNDMFDDGNSLHTGLGGGPVAYTNNAEATSLASEGWFGVGSSYATLKQRGIFVLAVQDMDGAAVGAVWVSGNLGSDSETEHAGGDFTVTVDSRQWTVYWRHSTDNRFSSSADPSVNQMFIVPGDGTGITYTFTSTLGEDDYSDEVDGLDIAGIDEIYYILVARRIATHAPRMEDTDIIDVVNAFLSLVA